MNSDVEDRTISRGFSNHESGSGPWAAAGPIDANRYVQFVFIRGFFLIVCGCGYAALRPSVYVFFQVAPWKGKERNRTVQKQNPENCQNFHGVAKVGLESRMLTAESGSPVNQMRLTVSGLQIRCFIAGVSGPPVLLLHGAGLDAAGLSLGRAMSVLADTCRVFAPDLPGFGESDPMPAGWGFAELSAFLSPLLDELGLPRASLVGISMGGGVALGFALRAPHRVERLALIDSACLDDAIPGGRLTWFLVHVPGLNLIGWWLLKSSRHLMRWTLLRAMRHRPDLVTPTLVDELMRLVRKRRAGAASRHLQRREVGWNRLRTNYVNRLPEIAIPTLILHGEYDQLLPVCIAERAHRLIRSSRLEVIHNCGHVAPLEQPEAVNRALHDFLQPKVA